MLKFGGAVIWRLGTKPLVRKYSSSSATVFKTVKDEANKDATVKSAKVGEEDIQNTGLVAAVFASLSSPEPLQDNKRPSPKSVKFSKSQNIDSQIAKAKNIDQLLIVAENTTVSRRHSLKIVSILSEWMNINKVQISDFEKDPRFLKLCRILARTSTSHAINSLNMAEDLSTVLGITGDDEAARLIGNLTLSQMVKVMKALTQKGRRSTPLLRALSNNIVKQADPIDIKKSTDLLFSMAALNFPDPVLLDRICSDIMVHLDGGDEKSSLVSSALTSLGVLRWRHETTLSSLSAWIKSRAGDVPPAAVAAAAVTLATVHYEDQDLFQLAAKIKEDDLTKPSAWLDLVFALLIMNEATLDHLTSTVRPDFIEKLLTSGEIPIPARRKLMTIDGYISLAHPTYSGPRLSEEISSGVPLLYTKEKTAYVQSVMDTFRNLVSADGFLKKECNSNMGFLYDGEIALDSKCHPVPLNKAVNNKSVFRIALLCLDYHDHCRKTPVPLGAFHLYTRLLEIKGFKVLQIPYTEFNPKDKLVTRVQYIERRLKEIVSDKTAS